MDIKLKRDRLWVNVKLGTSRKHKKTSSSHTMPSKLSVFSSTHQKYELKEGKLLKFDLLTLMLEQQEPSVPCRFVGDLASHALMQTSATLVALIPWGEVTWTIVSKNFSLSLWLNMWKSTCVCIWLTLSGMPQSCLFSL